MEILGFTLPLWAIFLVGILLVLVAWKLIKFAIKIVLVLVVLFIILMGLDYFGIFDAIQGLVSTIVSYPLY
jgi:hypothetical protein